MSRPSGKQFAALFVLILLTGYGIGFLGRHYQLPPYRTLQRLTRWAEDRSPLGAGAHPAHGQWFQARPRTRALPAEAMERLAALGYVGGYEPPPELVGVTRHDPGSAFRGLNLYTSGHGPEALLVDMDGVEVHRWRYSFAEAFPGRQATDNDTWWRRVHVYPNGDLLAVFDGLGLIRIDRHSNLKWARAGGFHHDAFVGEDGTIYVLYGEGRVIERFHEREPLVEEFILALDSQGNTRSRISLLEAFERSDYAPLLRNMPEFGDIFHTNTLDILEAPESGSLIFERGQALISVRNLHVIATVDLESQKVVWARTGMWAFQHQPVVLSNGNLMVFDNGVHLFEEQSAQFWPTPNAGGSFDWNVMDAPSSSAGSERLHAQFIRANIDPSERYVLSVPKSVQTRLSANGTDFANLYLCGDWTLNGLNVGCMEATFTSGLQASRAIAGYPKTIPGEHDWPWEDD